MNVVTLILNTILANIGLKWYYQVYVIGYSIDFLPYKYKKSQKYPYYPISTSKRKYPRNRYIKNIGFKSERWYWFLKIEYCSALACSVLFAWMDNQHGRHLLNEQLFFLSKTKNSPFYSLHTYLCSQKDCHAKWHDWCIIIFSMSINP